jgi:AcrR family transcriptional regulator
LSRKPAEKMDVEVDAPPASGRGTARDRIVTAAYSVLARQGYTETSIKDIAREAGIAPGLVHYYFENKAALLLEVVGEVCRRYHAELDAMPVPSDPLEAAAVRILWARERVSRIPDWYRLSYDLNALALRDPKLGAEVAETMREFREHIRLMVTEAVKLAGVEREDVSHEGVAAVLLASFNGLALQSLLDPSFDLGAAYNALSQMALGLLKPARG